MLVLSGARFLAARKGRIVACKVVPRVIPDDFTSSVRVSYRNVDGMDAIGTAVPDLIDWYPVSALGQRVGAVNDTAALIRLVERLFR
ncbi:hypothetical protein [Nocardia sp.]|uniref:hypothetical protein n=1 Tax=Nocardia sp. TaxID=1821 RepID=UPI002628CC32|nr:hypothetical protein [Nocardia sp.]